MVELEQARMEILSQISEKVLYYFEVPRMLEEKAAKALRKKSGTEELIRKYTTFLEKEFSKDPKALEEASRQFTEAEGAALKDLAQPLRHVTAVGPVDRPHRFRGIGMLQRERPFAGLVNQRPRRSRGKADEGAGTNRK